MAVWTSPPTQDSTADALACDHGQRRYIVTRSMVIDILRGDIAAGQHLVISELARRYDVSPTPIREAIVALEGLGLVDVQPNRGAVVRRLTETDAREICQVRRALECEAVKLVCERAVADDFANLAENCRRIRRSQRATVKLIEQCREVDSHLHDGIAKACGNRMLSRELDRLTLLIRSFRDAAWRQYEITRNHQRLVEEAEEHLDIISCIQRGDGPQAGLVMAKHIDGGLKYWIRALPAAR